MYKSKNTNKNKGISPKECKDNFETTDKCKNFTYIFVKNDDGLRGIQISPVADKSATGIGVEAGA